MVARLLSLALLLTSSAVAAQTRTVWRDTFGAGMRYERHSPAAWLGGGRFRAGEPVARLLPPVAALTQVTVRAEVTPGRRTVPGYALVGIGLHLDAANAWQLLLAEAPDGRRYFDLVEDLEGVHQAQSAPASTTELEARLAEGLPSWEYGRRYSLTLTLGPDGLVGEVADPQSPGLSWRKEFVFGPRRALRSGRPALIAAGAAGAFHLFEAAAPTVPARATLAVRAGKAGSVVVLKGKQGRVAERLGAAFESAGFGVTLVGWDELDRAPLPDAGVDLLALADARTLPVAARDEVVRRLASGGRVMAIGAPAASKLLARTAGGWTDQEGWVQALARSVGRVPLEVAPEAWLRTAQNSDREASIALDPSQGDRAWKVSADLQGWDGWYAPTPGAFGADRSLLVFEARGDTATTQLAVECVEDDGSRWIAAVPLGAAWRHYVLGPGDFAYWLDSQARGRGFAGDRLRPSRLARLSFALSASHTPKVRPGPHTYWVRGLSTATDAGRAYPDFSVPDVEALWPSYKLYPMDSIASLRGAPEQGIVSPAFRAAWTRPAYSPVWRERGRGYGRGRAWRWIPVLEAYDRSGRKRGALLSVTVGDGTSPNAVWANLAVSDPSDALREAVLPALVHTARAMVRGAFLLEGGAEHFSYRPGEPIVLGARGLNAGSAAAATSVEVRVTDSRGMVVFRRRAAARVAPGSASDHRWTFRPTGLGTAGLTVTTELRQGSAVVDRIAHRIDRLRTTPARLDEFVRVKDSMFTLGGKPWYFQGINYWPTWMAGYPSLNQRSRECYDPEIIERDLAWLRSAGVNVLSAVQAIMPPDPDAPGAFRDQLDFLDRCLRHGIRCYVTLPAGRAYAGADFAKIKDYIERSGLRNHPAVMCWELAWEPIEGAWGNSLDVMRDDWNRWLVEQYGTVDAAVAVWGFDPRQAPGQLVPAPTMAQCTASGRWDRYVAAFSRAFSDLIGRRYGEVVRPLREWDPNHLITFRGGACGIPTGPVFAHIHSVGVARHMAFLCPEGYNLQTGGWANPTPPDDVRKGGLVTHYYRWVSREKPVVWMEFGYTANGFGGAWQPERVRLKPVELERQRVEVERFYAMFVESGSRGAAPWWLPGGYRLGENSDFGLLEPDGAERPSARVFRAYQPRFAGVEHGRPDAVIEVDFDRDRWRAWDLYSARYLELVKQGRTPELRSAGTGTTSATCPLTAVGGGDHAGSGPLQHLNSEFDRLEVRVGEGPWREVRAGDTVEARPGQAVRCRAWVGNIGEAAWLRADGVGGVRLAGSIGDTPFSAPIDARTPYLGQAEVVEFALARAPVGPVQVSVQMEAVGRVRFGERRTFALVPGGVAGP